MAVEREKEGGKVLIPGAEKLARPGGAPNISGGKVREKSRSCSLLVVVGRELGREYRCKGLGGCTTYWVGLEEGSGVKERASS